MTERICYLHVGTGKTGSSAIQYALTKSAGALHQAGYLYPDASDNFERVLALKPTAGNGLRVNTRIHLGDIGKALEQLSAYVQDPSHLILSSEGFVNAQEEHLVAFGAGLRRLGYRTRSLVFYRHQHDMVVSSYLQQVKSDKMDPTLNLADYASDRYSRPRNPMNWLLRTGRLERAFDDVTVKWYPALSREGPNGVVDAVFRWLGLPPPTAEHAAIVNPTPGREALSVLRELNARGQGGKRIADELLARAYGAGLLGSKVVIDVDVAQAIHAAMYESNAELLRRYCPELDPAAELTLPFKDKSDNRALNEDVVAELRGMADEIVSRVGTEQPVPARRRHRRREPSRVRRPQFRLGLE
jgi:hypothetical protein